MTRKKWNRLKRKRPDLFKQFDTIGSGWETVKNIPEVRYWGMKEAVEQMTARITYRNLANSGE